MSLWFDISDIFLTLFHCFIKDDTLQNCTLELATVGDLKLVERPQPVVLAPLDFCNIKATVKVSSTENGIIFGNIGKFECNYNTTKTNTEFLIFFLLKSMMQQILPTLSFLTPFTSTLWITFCQPRAPIPNSAACGSSSNGRIKSQLIPQFRTYTNT